MHIDVGHVLGCVSDLANQLCTLSCNVSNATYQCSMTILCSTIAHVNAAIYGFQTAVLWLQVPFSSLGPVYQVLNKHNAQQCTEQYSETGEVLIDAEVDVSSVEEMQQEMLNATHGLVKLQLQQ